MPVVPLNMHLKWFLRTVAIKLISHIEKCSRTIMRKSVLVPLCGKSVPVPPYGKTDPVPPYGKLCSYPHAIKLLHHIKNVLVPLYSQGWRSHINAVARICFQKVLIDCCQNIDPSYRKLCRYPHAIKLLHHIEKCARTLISYTTSSDKGEWS